MMYKGFNKDMTCRGFQFEQGKTYQEERAELCESGFHACEFPMDCLSYYAPGESRYCEVDLDELSDERRDDSKRVGKKITVQGEIGVAGLVKASVKIVRETAKGNSTTGDWANAATTGDWANAEVKGKNAVAVSIGRCGMAKGALGCWIVCAEYSDNGKLLAVLTARVDGEKIKPDTWYRAKNGELVEVKSENDG